MVHCMGNRITSAPVLGAPSPPPPSDLGLNRAVSYTFFSYSSLPVKCSCPFLGMFHRGPTSLAVGLCGSLQWGHGTGCEKHRATPASPLAPSLQPPQVRETARKTGVDRYMSSVINDFTFLEVFLEGTVVVLKGKLRHVLQFYVRHSWSLFVPSRQAAG